MNDSEKNSYSVAALAAELGVPRTTVNDWLSRYADFMDSELSGRRRLYTGRTLAVLREIAALRDQGGSGTEIAEMLARRHGVRPDVAAAEAAPKPAGATSAPETEEDAPPDAETSFPVALRRFDENFEAFGKWMLEQRTLQEAQKRRQRLTLTLVLTLLVILLAAVAAGVWAVRYGEMRRRVEQEALYDALRRQRESAALMQEKIASLETGVLEERRAAAEAARKAAAEKEELLAGQRQAMTAMREAWTAERAAQEARWTELQAKHSADQQALAARWEKFRQESEEARTREMERARNEEKRLQDELDAARRALREAEEKLRAHENAPAAPAPGKDTTL